MGFSSSFVNAAAVISWTLGDFDNDGLTSDFDFSAAPTGNGTNAFAPSGETCGGAACSPILFDTGSIGTNVFTTGFNFGGTGIFEPNVTGDMSATINNGILAFSALDFGGIFGGTQFFLAPVGDPGSVTVETLTDLGGGTGVLSPAGRVRLPVVRRHPSILSSGWKVLCPQRYRSRLRYGCLALA